MKKSLSIFACTCLATALFAQQNIQRSIFFESNQSVVQPNYERILRNFADSVKPLQGYSIVLKGHTDAIGSNVSNRQLSIRRVKNVQQSLEKKGIPTTLISTAAFGEDLPVDDNATETGKQNNRRVDIIVQFKSAEAIIPVAGAQKYNNMLDLYKDLSQKAQVFKINTSRDTIIKGAQGTTLFIPQGAFQNVPVGAIVDFQLKEAYKYSDMIAENLNTKSGDKLLQTGGMFHAEAHYDHQILALKRDLKVTFPSPESQLQGMQLFKGNRDNTQTGSIDWQPMNYTLEKESLPTVTTSRILYHDSRTGFNPYFLSNPNEGLRFKDLVDTVGAFPLLSAAEVRAAMSGKVTVKRTTKLSEIGVAMSYHYYLKPPTSQKMLLQAHRETFSALYNFYNVNDFNTLQKQDGSLWDAALQNRAQTLANAIDKKEYDKRVDSILSTLSEAKAKYIRASNAFRNAFTLPELGWVNCDRFLEYPMEQLAQIKTSKMLFYPASSKLILVLSDRNIATDIIQWEHKPTFQKVPKDENAFVVAMKIENGQPYMSFHSVRTANMEVDLDFKLVTAAEIREKLKLLDNG